jgi:hypothetical protein
VQERHYGVPKATMYICSTSSSKYWFQGNCLRTYMGCTKVLAFFFLGVSGYTTSVYSVVKLICTVLMTSQPTLQSMIQLVMQHSTTDIKFFNRWTAVFLAPGLSYSNSSAADSHLSIIAPV